MKNQRKAKITWYSYLTLGWLTKLMFEGARKPLQAEQLLALPDSFEADKLSNFLSPFWRKRATASVLFIRAFGGFVVLSVLYQAASTACSLIQPTYIKELIIFLNTYGIGLRDDVSTGVKVAFILFGLQLGSVVFRSLSSNLLIPVQVKVRTILVGAIYEKSLRLSQKASYEFSQGQILNLVNVDVEKVVGIFLQLAPFLCSPIQFGVSLYLIQKEIGNAMWGGAGALIGVIVLQTLAIGFLVAFQQGFLKLGDQRLKSLREMLYGIKVIKFRSLETFFLNRVNEIRTNQLKYLKRYYMVQVYLVGLIQIAPIAAPVVGFMLYGSEQKGVIAPEVVFPTLTLFNGLFQTILIIPQGIIGVIVGLVSWKRVFDFLRAEEEIKSSFDQENAIERGNIVFDNASFKWDKRNGDVMKPSAEKPRVNQNSSALEKSENTKVNSALEKIEYPEVKTDDGFSLADVSINIPTGCKVGIVGAVGSGKSSLFSALIGEMRSTSGVYGFNGKLSYCVQQPWILTDTVRGNIVFNNTEDEKRLEHVIKLCGLEKDLRELPSGDQTEIGEKGINLSGGQKARIALARALYQDTDIYLLDDPLSALDAHVGRTVFDNVVMKALNGKTVLLVTHQLHMIHELDYIVVMGHGKVVEQGKYDDLIEQKGLLFELMKSYSIDKKKALVDESANADPKKELISEEGIISKEDQEQGAVKAKVFWSYIEACGGWSFLLFIIFAALLNSGTQVMTNIWLTWWSEGKEDRFGLKLTRFDPNTTNFYLTWYGALAILQFVLALLLNAGFLFGAYKAAKLFHRKAVSRLIKAPMGFFDSQPIGRILNRLSKDVESVDQNIWLIAFLTTIAASGLISSTALLVYVEWRMVLLLVPLLTFYLIMIILYQRSNRELKRYESTFKSPLYAHISETLSGITTVKAYNVENSFVDKERRLIDDANCPTFLRQSASIWINIRMESLSTLVVLLLALLGLLKAISPSLMGLALTYAIGFTGGLAFFLIMSSQLETELNSVERLAVYCDDLPQEASFLNPEDPDTASWPLRGQIEIERITLSYPSRPDQFVLKDLTFTVQPGEKVGIVGRTGSGKSTLMLALFRILELHKGSIRIDGIDISILGLETLRKRLQIIPQDPVLFSGTIRSNLDVEGEYSDEDIWEVLELIGLKDYVSKSEEKLESEVEENGSNLSVGQRQLICLGRAILVKPKILIMDEATASVDNLADKMIQSSIKSHFQNTTILCIAHRLNTIADFDRVLVLKDGMLEEYDTPISLLDKKGLFSELVDATGPSNAQLIRQIAKSAKSEL